MNDMLRVALAVGLVVASLVCIGGGSSLDGDVYFLFNESYETRSEQLRIEGAFNEVLMLDPETGKPVATDVEGDLLSVTLPGARGAVLWVTR
jgi:hypothetical protein